MVQRGGGLGLDLEPLKLAGVHRRGEREDLKGDPAFERNLVGLVNDAHAASANLAHQPVVTQTAQPGHRIGVRIAEGRLTMRRVPQAGHQREGREQPVERLGPLGLPAGEFLPVDGLSGPNAGRPSRRPIRPRADRPGLRRRGPRSRRVALIVQPHRDRGLRAISGLAPGPGNGEAWRHSR